MNLRLAIFTALVLQGMVSVRADEQLATLQVGSDTYSNVTVTTVTPTDVYFTYNNGRGMANAKLKKLNPDLQEHFHYNPAKASAVEQKQAQANVQYHAQATDQSVSKPLAYESFVKTGRLIWSLDFDQALARAKVGNKMVLIDFTGSDWCPWCIKLDHDVLSADKFADYAESGLILVQVDFLRHTVQNAALRKANQELAQRFQVDSFPTLVVLNSAGKEIGRQVGYLRGGPDALIAKLNEFGE